YETLFEFVEIRAERKWRKKSSRVEWRKRTLDTLRRVFARGARQFILLWKLARILRLTHQFGLEARIRDREHRGNHILIVLAAKIGDPIFRYDDIAKMPGNGFVAVIPSDIGL